MHKPTGRWIEDLETGKGFNLLDKIPRVQAKKNKTRQMEFFFNSEVSA